jgi:chemotaxis protein histidine kinase CheA
MLELFQGELDTHIPALNEGLLALEKGEVDARAIEAMMRAAHSIKGAARIVGISQAVRLAHEMEDCFTSAKEGRISLPSEAVDVLLQAVDTLGRICSPQESSAVSEAGLDELLSRLSLLRSGGTASSPAPLQTPRVSQPSAQLPAVSATIDPGTPRVILPAEFDEVSSEMLRQELLNKLATGTVKLELDFTSVANLSAAALALLVSFSEHAGLAQPPPVLESRRVSPAVRAVLRVAGLDTMFGLAS